ncbi:hypothetical protein BBG47_00455 [Paenibacillus sp. KS1]|uniref:WYL domain-containing protein n=1 Tax=Paenibacillus sp. KS1 TaxID=1849249 RepID=UPI0008065B9A|nr:WYL domain-containing protein [Paenibacillus sp. KS1]OBY81585.1 hypothetical protein BBG47_00455 [Paenibacillus sp. KS1]
MNPFEKIFGYQILSRLEDAGTFVVTSHERAWLKTMLAHPAASEAFSEDTITKLHEILSSENLMDTSHNLIEKAKSKEKHVYHPMLRPLRRYISSGTGIRISYAIKGGRINEEHEGLPYKLEYSIIKREWYLLWYHRQHRGLMNTKLRNITSLTAESIPPAEAEYILTKLARLRDRRKSEVVIEVIREYNRELSRILYAFSCFETEVMYDEEQRSYQIRIRLPWNEHEFLLSKIRFLGKRVRVKDSAYLQKRMRETAAMALARYEENSV